MSLNDAAPIVTLRGVGKAFAAVAALEGFDFTVRRGEFVSLLGPSGCGKSTALRRSAGRAPPTSATREGAAGEPAPGALGFVFQEPTLMPWASVSGNVQLPLKLLALDRSTAEERVKTALTGVGLAEFARAYPRELSG